MWGACWGREMVVQNSFRIRTRSWGLCKECGRASHDAPISESRCGAPASVAGPLESWRSAISLFCFVPFEKLSRFFEGERVSVDDQFVFAGVFRDGDDALDTMGVLAQGLDDEIDVYHA